MSEWMAQLASSGNQEHLSTCQKFWGIAVGWSAVCMETKVIMTYKLPSHLWKRREETMNASWLRGSVLKVTGACSVAKATSGTYQLLGPEVTRVGNSSCCLLLTLADILGKSKITTMSSSQWGKLCSVKDRAFAPGSYWELQERP